MLAFTALQENPTLQQDALWIFDEFQDFNRAEERFVAECTRQAVEQFIEAHREDLTRRRQEILESVHKEPFLLVLSSSRDITAYLGDDGQSILQLIEEWRLEDGGPGTDYLRVRDYYRHDLYPQNNFTLRKVLEHNSVDAETVRDLIDEALSSRKTLRDVEQTPIADAANISKLVSQTVTTEDQPVEQQAALLTNIVLVTDAGRLAADLEAFPLVPMPGQDDFLEVSQRAAPVEFSTISGSKGLSADHVIILGADNINMSGVSPEVFYVGLTRARESLHLIQAWGARGAREHHEYVMALPEEHCDYVKYETAGVTPYDNRDAMLVAVGARERAARRRR